MWWMYRGCWIGVTEWLFLMCCVAMARSKNKKQTRMVLDRVWGVCLAVIMGIHVKVWSLSLLLRPCFCVACSGCLQLWVSNDRSTIAKFSFLKLSLNECETLRFGWDKKKLKSNNKRTTWDNNNNKTPVLINDNARRMNDYHKDD
jgi:hypothetical protein